MRSVGRVLFREAQSAQTSNATATKVVLSVRIPCGARTTKEEAPPRRLLAVVAEDRWNKNQFPSPVRASARMASDAPAPGLGGHPALGAAAGEEQFGAQVYLGFPFLVQIAPPVTRIL